MIGSLNSRVISLGLILLISECNTFYHLFISLLRCLDISYFGTIIFVPYWSLVQPQIEWRLHGKKCNSKIKVMHRPKNCDMKRWLHCRVDAESKSQYFIIFGIKWLQIYIVFNIIIASWICITSKTLLWILIFLNFRMFDLNFMM